ncbi:MAG: hypothetical protein U0271_19240 [Polyangiaceae bacterium]
MNRTLYSSLLVAVVALVGCGDEAGTGSGSNSAAKSGGSAKTSSSAPAAASTPAPATTTAAPAGSGSAAAGGAMPKVCEDYLAKIKECGGKNDAAKTAMEMVDKSFRDSLAQQKDDAAKEMICKTSLDAWEKTPNPACK